MYKGVTHFGSLKGKEFITNEFLKEVSFFKQQPGPIFIQLSETFSPKRKDELIEWLEKLPANFNYFLEIRHPEWFKDKEILAELLSKLTDLKIGIVITDTPGRRDCVHMHLTIPKTYIRFVANSVNPTDLKRIDYWCDRIKYWIDKGLEEMYFIVHIHEESDSPQFTYEVVERLNRKCGLDIIRPVLIKKNKDLFE